VFAAEKNTKHRNSSKSYMLTWLF